MTGTETIACPNCQGVLGPYDRRRRNLIEEDGWNRQYLLRRLRCESCLKMHTELPAIMIPYKRYSAAVVGTVAGGKGIGVPFEERTRQKIRAWYKAVKGHLLGIWQQQVKRGFVSPDLVPGLVFLVRAAVNSGNWPFHPFGRLNYAL